MPSLKELILPSLSAQQADAIAQPTFGRITVRGGTQSRANVVLSSDKTSLQVGEKVKFKVAINTGTNQISSYTIVIDFDPSKFSVIDVNPQVIGTQITKLDNTFQFQNEEQNNRVDPSGRIILTAYVQNPVELNKEVVEFELQAQQAGISKIKIAEGSTGTQLIRQSGATLNYTLNEISLQINSQPGSNNNTNNNNNTSNTTNNNSNNNPNNQQNNLVEQNPGNGGTTVPGQIPNTSITSDPVSVLLLMLGILLTFIGLRLGFRSKR